MLLQNDLFLESIHVKVFFAPITQCISGTFSIFTLLHIGCPFEKWIGRLRFYHICAFFNLLICVIDQTTP